MFDAEINSDPPAAPFISQRGPTHPRRQTISAIRVDPASIQVDVNMRWRAGHGATRRQYKLVVAATAQIRVIPRLMLRVAPKASSGSDSDNRFIIVAPGGGLGCRRIRVSAALET